MSYALNITGHVGSAETALAIDELLTAVGAELVDKIRELDPSAVSSASFSGPSGYTNYLLDDETIADTPAVVEAPAPRPGEADEGDPDQVYVEEYGHGEAPAANAPKPD